MPVSLFFVKALLMQAITHFGSSQCLHATGKFFVTAPDTFTLGRELSLPNTATNKSLPSE
jgi:hypothetical protein